MFPCCRASAIRSHRSLRLWVAVAWMCPALATQAADGVATDADANLETVTIVARGVSNMDAASTGDISQEDLAAQPLLRPGAVLENVPGLIVTQHSGEGKANQYFLRAFNLDHGTDLATGIDDMPVNMPTHAHGQGYSDLNFLIPELISDLHFKKGPTMPMRVTLPRRARFAWTCSTRSRIRPRLGFGQDGYRRALLLGIHIIGRRHASGRR